MMNWVDKPKLHEGLHLSDGPKTETNPKAIIVITLAVALGAAGLYAYRNAWVDLKPSASKVAADARARAGEPPR